MISEIKQLRSEASWDPGAILAAAAMWPGNFPRLRLEDIVGQVHPAAQATTGMAVVAPSGLDPIRGGIGKRRRDMSGVVYQVGGSARGLQPGDLLVPPRASSHVLLIAPEHVGALFAGSFIAIRPIADLHPLWLWGALNSESGQRIRAALEIGSVLSRLGRAEFFGMKVPVASMEGQEDLTLALGLLEASTHGHEMDAVESWWRGVDLTQSADWKVLLATPTPEVIDEGEPLRLICDEIAAGSLVQKEMSTVPLPGWLPVMDIKRLSSGRNTRWVEPQPKQTLANPGDVVVAQNGTRNLATVVMEPTVVAKGTLRIRLRDTDVAHGLARYLNGEAGHALRSIFMSGAFIPRLSRNDLERIPVPADALAAGSSKTEDQAPLAARLERVLWG